MMPLYHRNIIVDNSRVGVDNARVGPEELIDIKKGFFKVPKKAAGKGSRPHPKRMNFRKSSRGGGSFSIQKFMLQNLDLQTGLFDHEMFFNNCIDKNQNKVHF